MDSRPTLNSVFFGGMRFLLAALFLVAGALKLSDPASFADDIRNYRLMPEALTAPVALYLPWFEVAVGVALLGRRFRSGAVLGSALLASVFLIAVGSAWWRGLDISCGCFGQSAPSSLPLTFLRNAGMTLAAFALLRRDLRLQAEPGTR